jgi:PAS domain S-box-containing protein
MQNAPFDAEERLRESEGRFAAFMDNLPGYAWLKDLQGRYVYINQAVRGLPGYQSLGKTDAQIWPADLAATYRANDQQVITTKKPLHTIEHFLYEGKQRCMVGSKFPIFDKTGAVALVGGAGVDITERIEAEGALRESEHRFRTILRTAVDGFWRADVQGRFLEVNEAYCRMSGYSEQELLALSISDVEAQEIPSEVVAHIRSIMARGEDCFESRHRRKDGSIFPVEVSAQYKTSDGGQIVAFLRDVTERKRAEEAVREGQELLRLVLATLPVGVAVTDRAGDIVLANAASKLIWGDIIVSGPERWAKSKGSWHDSGQGIAPTEWASVRALSEGKTSLNELIDVETYDGKRKTIQNSSAPIRNAEGLIVGAVIVNEDVTERVRAENALRESTGRLQHLSRRLLAVQEDERRRLSRELHDEFGQLLTAVAVHLQAAKGLAGDAARPRLEECSVLLERTSAQVSSLAFELRPTMLEAAGLEPTLRWLAEQHQQRTGIATQVVGHLNDVPSDLEIACFRAAQEALTNVVRHARAQHVWIELNQTNDALELLIRDDGAGFDVTRTLDRAASSGHLGLLGMKERVQILGGNLEVDSEPGHGTGIRISLPLATPVSKAAESEA